MAQTRRRIWHVKNVKRPVCQGHSKTRKELNYNKAVRLAHILNFSSFSSQIYAITVVVIYASVNLPHIHIKISCSYTEADRNYAVI